MNRDTPSCSSSRLIALKGFKILCKLGSGSFATVYKAQTENEEHKEVAIKAIDKTKLSDTMFGNIVNEIKVLKMLHHEHIVTMLDFLWDERYVYIILEYCEGGDLSHFIKRKEKLSEFLCQRFVQQLCLALKFLRENNVCHLDLKPQNILLKNNSLKLADFGFAQILKSDTPQSCKRGSPLYMAPEVLSGDEYDSKADLWSLGVIVFECLFGHAPYANCNIKELKQEAQSSEPINIPPNNLSLDCIDFLTRLLQKNPRLRMDHEEVFRHPFPDLDHCPGSSSYQKAISLVQKAVEKDSNGHFNEALSLYCEALNFLIPLAYEEPDLVKKKELQKKIGEYKTRVEMLKSVVVKEHHISPSYSSLRNVRLDAPNVKSGIEIGETGEMYLAEGKCELALEKFKSSLMILIPICKAERDGPMKTLLSHQIQEWMKTAEHLQTILDASKLEIEEQCASTKMWFYIGAFARLLLILQRKRKQRDKLEEKKQSRRSTNKEL